MGSTDDYIRSRRTPEKVRHAASERKDVVVDLLSGKKTRQQAGVRPAHSTESPCVGCEHFNFPGQSDSTCSTVAGRVQEMDTCDHHQQRDQGSPAQEG